MEWPHHDPVRIAKATLLAAALLMIVAVLLSPRILVELISPSGAAYNLVVAISALLAAKGIHSIADGLLLESVEPWYARRGGLVLLVSTVTCTAILATAAFTASASRVSGVTVAEDPGRVLLFLSLELCWIILLAPPRPPVSHRTRPAREIPQAPRFRHYRRNAYGRWQRWRRKSGQFRTARSRHPKQSYGRGQDE